MKCPTCNSPMPHLHPSVQFEGEVELCTDEFHLSASNQNSPRIIAMVEEKRKAIKPRHLGDHDGFINRWL